MHHKKASSTAFATETASSKGRCFQAVNTRLVQTIKVMHICYMEEYVGGLHVHRGITVIPDKAYRCSIN